MKLGVISDTHGLLRPEVTRALRGVDQIIHAGDVGSAAVLAVLSAIAPVVAVRGNTDGGALTQQLPMTAAIALPVGGQSICIYVLHELPLLDVHPPAAGIRCVIYGHTHFPSTEVRQGVLYLNPGSVGPRRPGRPVAMALLHVGPRGELTAESLLLEE